MIISIPKKTIIKQARKDPYNHFYSKEIYIFYSKKSIHSEYIPLNAYLITSNKSDIKFHYASLFTFFEKIQMIPIHPSILLLRSACNASVGGREDVTATYIRWTEILLHMYVKYQYKTRVGERKRSGIMHSNKRNTRVYSYHRVWFNIYINITSLGQESKNTKVWYTKDAH